MTQSYNLSQLANNLNTAGQLDATDGLSGAVPPANGGTGQSTYTTGDILYASGSTALAKLSDVATGNVLISGGVGASPSYGKVGLTTHVSGTLPVPSGGTGLATITSNAVILGNGTSNVQTVSPSTAGNLLTSDGTTWSSSPPIPFGLGIGQTWTNMLSPSVLRAFGTSYTNSTGKPILVYVGISSGSMTPTVGGVALPITVSANGNTQTSTSFIVPTSTSYSIAGSGLASWAELR